MLFNVMVDKMFWVPVLWINLSRPSVVNVKPRGSRRVNWERVLIEMSPWTFCRSFVTCPSCKHPRSKCLQSLQTPQCTQGCWGNTPILSPLHRHEQVVAPTLGNEAKQPLWSPWQLQGLICFSQQLISNTHRGLGLISTLHSLSLQRALPNTHAGSSLNPPGTATGEGWGRS